jgi:hypothetical protein
VFVVCADFILQPCVLAAAFRGSTLFNYVNKPHLLPLQIRRPSNYNPEEAAPLGPATPDPTVTTAHLPMCKTVVEDTWDKIFVGGLPCNYGDEQVCYVITS